MKKTSTIVLAVVIFASLFTFSSCKLNCKRGSGKMITETRSVGSFSQIEVSGSYRVVIKQDSAEKLSITGDDNLMQYIKTETDGSRLKIHNTRSICTSGQYTIYISLKELSYIGMSGSTSVFSDGKITVKDIELKTSGATKVNLNLNADNVRTISSGLADIFLEGQAQSHTLKTSGSSTVNALDFVVNKYRIESSGLSHCRINVLNNLSVDSSGSSDIEYRGNPTDINNNKSGISSLKQVN
ncbi:head GIN domain-containing protein [Mucilaginibacter sp. AW1-3]